MSSPAGEDGSPSADNESPGWPEPPWSGWIETTGDALLILEAARRGLIPRVTRRLVDSERKMITSGSVFVFDEDESGIKRWTDGFVWSPSRILGNFLLYRETEKRSGNRPKAEQEPLEQDSSGSKKGKPNAAQALSQGLDKHRERLLLGSLTNSHKFKVDGMIKKTFSLTIGGVSQHLISYYRVADVENGRLRSPSSLPELATLEISPEYLDKTHFRQPPRVEIGPDGVPRYRGEADETQLTALSNPGSRSHRFKPYADDKAPKKARKGRGQRANSQSENEASNYPADSYPYPTYPGYPYGTGSYPYMQYPGHSAPEGGSGEVTNYNPYVAGYLWPGYNTSGAAVAEANEEDDDGEEKGGGEEISGSVAAV